MSERSSTYRIAGLALLLGMALVLAVPPICQQVTAHESSKAHSHSTAPCVGPCHVLAAPANAAIVPVVDTDRGSGGPDGVPALQAPSPVHVLPSHRSVTGPVRTTALPVSLPVRLHLFNAVFLI